MFSAASKTAQSSSAGPADPYFYDVSLLLNGDGTNGAQNNTFLDSSTNNFTITRNGNTTQGSFSPYGNLWSNNFNGSSYLTWSGSSVGAGAYTFECWFNLSVMPSVGNLQSLIGPATAITNGLGLNIQNSTTLEIDQYGVVGNNFTVPTMTTGTWYHVAYVRNASGVETVFLNGVRSSTGTITDSASYANSTAIGFTGGSVSRYFNGYISNARLVVGSNVYDPTQTTITVPTAPLTAISGTQLLSCQSNRFIDNSSNNYTLSTSGSPSVQRFSPFNPTAPYSTATIGGSAYTDSSSDLSIAYNSALNFGSNDFTIEGWWYAVSQPNDEALWAQKGGSQYFILQPSVSGNHKLALYIDPLGAAPAIQGTTTLITGTWYHVALVRQSSVFTLYLNGVQEGGTYTNSGNPTPSSGTTYINGQNYPVGAGWNGYCSGFRIVNGSAVYTSTFTPPTAPPTAITNTALLSNMTNAGIPDLAMQNDLQTVGSAQVSTSTVKYGTGSLYFDGSTGYLTAPNKPVYQLGSGDFTIECWINFNSLSTNRGILYFATAYDSAFSYGLQWASNNLYFWYSTSGGAASYLSAPWTPSTGTWYHLAVTRNGSNLKFFINGTQIGTTQSLSGITLYATSANLIVGGELGGSGGSLPGKMSGYIDDLRITDGYARYVSNFTPPTAALPSF